jgi:hypothetical protein
MLRQRTLVGAVALAICWLSTRSAVTADETIRASRADANQVQDVERATFAIEPDRSFISKAKPNVRKNIRPVYPIQRPLDYGPVGLRGGPFPPGACVTEPCEIPIYINLDTTGINAAGGILDDTEDVPLYDDCALVGTERFVCRVVVTAGGITNAGNTIPLTLILRSGNYFPICPEDSQSIVLYTATQNLQLTNPLQLVTFNIDPPVLMDVDFLWVGLQVDRADENSDDASWSIAGEVDTVNGDLGFTEDGIVIPNGNGTCEDLGAGQDDDYFFYGGPPTVAGQETQIFANPGPPGACCDRDTNDGMGNGTCTDGVLRADCLVTTTAVWKTGLCADFNMTNPACDLCISHDDACAGATVSAEPDCSAGYVDMTNAGCLSVPNNFDSLACDDIICGSAGTYAGFCTADTDCAAGITCDLGTNSCQGPDDSRDNDWYEMVLTADTEVTVTLSPRFASQLLLIDNGGDTMSCTDDNLEFRFGRACEVLTITRCLPPGNWWFVVRPDTFTGVPCDTRYRLTATCEPCLLPIGACCDTSMTGCTELAQIACTGSGGQYLGDLTTCAVQGAACPGVPDNDECTTKILLTGEAVSEVFNNLFATNSGSPNPQPADCSIGQLNNGLVITKDIFYNYQIPTIVQGEAVTAGDLVISTIGSNVDTWVVVYGDVGATAVTEPCGASLCSKPQIECNDNLLDNGTIFKVNSLSHMTLSVEDGSTAFLDPGDCIKIRVGRGRGAETPDSPLGGPGLLNIDFIPRSAPFSLETSRCCFPDGSCLITETHAECLAAGGGTGRIRPATDFNQGEVAVSEQPAGCQTDPCPAVGEACFRAVDLNAEFGGDSGTYMDSIHVVQWMKYVVPMGIGGLVIDSCGSDGFFDPILGVATTVNADSGDCELGSFIAFGDDCTSTDSLANAAVVDAGCYGGLNTTTDGCMCLSVGPMGDIQEDQTIYIAFGNANIPGKQFVFEGSPRTITTAVTEPLDDAVDMVINVTPVMQCFECPSACPAGPNVVQEGADLICVDTSDPEPQDLHNGGCLATPPSFNGPTLDCSLGPIMVCGEAGNFDHPIPCDSPADCISNGTCSAAVNGFCTGPSVFKNRDEDWFKVIVSEPSTLTWRVVSSAMQYEIGIVADPDGDCGANAQFLAINDVEFACAPQTGDPQLIEVSASVCAGTYIVVIRPAVFGGLGETSCDSGYVAEVSCSTFVPSDCCQGDLNGDGLINGRDIQKWIDTLFNPPTLFNNFTGCFDANYCRADTDQDGTITLSDRTSFVDLLVGPVKPVCPEVPVCGDPATSQLPTLGIGEGVTMSDLDLSDDRRAAECICPLEDGTLDTVCFWGAYLDFSLADCTAEDDCFQISFYETTANRCPGARICAAGTSEPACAQFIANANRVVTGGLISTAGGAVTEFFYSATLPNPLQVTAGECIWLEIVNNTPLSDCKWHWEHSPNGDTRHAVVDVDPPTGNLPSDYTACTAANIAIEDLALSVNVRIAKDGCGAPTGRCCFDDPPLGVLDCEITTEDICVAVRNGEWVEDGTCPADPACTVGRCCFLDGAMTTQCVETLQSTCSTLDGLWVEAASCPCPTGRCCVDQDCTVLVSEVACLAQGGQWLEGGNCDPPGCPVAICANAAQCQLPDIISNQQQGGYVSDADNTVTTADDIRPNFSQSQQYIDQVCFWGFHRLSSPANTDCLNLVTDVETFTITYYGTSGNLPDTGTIIGGPFNVTPVKTDTGEGVAQGGGVLFRYETFHAQVPVTASQCIWIEIVNTTVNLNCAFLWATSNEGGNLKAAIEKSGGADAFPYQFIDRDLAFCVGPTPIGSASCPLSPALPVPSNDLCINADDIGIGAVGPITGTTFGASKDAGAGSSCGACANCPDVWYTWTQGGAQVSRTFLTCFVNTTYDTVLSIHKTAGLPNGGCPGNAATTSQISLLQGCDDDGCPQGIGTNTLFFQGRQARRIVSTASNLPANTTFLIRISGAQKGGTSTNNPNGSFSFEVQ